MEFATVWRDLRERCESLAADDVLVTPDEERPFVVDRAADDRVVVTFLDGTERTLWRDQFGVLVDGVDDGGLSLSSLPPGVGPYVAVLSLAPQFVADADADVLRPAAAGEEAESVDASEASGASAVETPFVRSRWDVRRPPERVHDDAVLLADFLERHDATDGDALRESALVDLYVLLSDVQRGFDGLRRDVSEDLLDRFGPDGRLRGRYGTVSRVARERRDLRDEDAVLDRLDEAGIPREWVLGVDEDKLDVVLAATDLEATDVYDVSDRYHVRKTGVESEAKRARLEGLREKAAELPAEDADEIREEIDALEARIDDMLAAG